MRRRLLPEIHLSKREFLRLAGRRLRELFNEAPNARYLVGSELLSTELCQLFGGGLLPSPDLYKRDGHLTPFAISYADDRSVKYRRMGVKDIFDFAGINVLTAAYDHVLDSALHSAIAILVKRAEIAGMEPSLGNR